MSVLERQRALGAMLAQPHATRESFERLARELGVAGDGGAGVGGAGVGGAGVGGAARLRVLHEQRWGRLFAMLRGAFPRAARALGPRFAGLAGVYLAERPPRGAMLAEVGEGFASFLCTRVASPAVHDLARVDEAFFEVSRAPFAHDPPRLLPSFDVRLVRSPSVRVASQRFGFAGDGDVVPVEPRFLAIHRVGLEVHAEVLCEPEHALMCALETMSLEVALDSIARSHPEVGDVDVERWMRRSVARRHWSSVSRADVSPADVSRADVSRADVSPAVDVSGAGAVP